MRIPAHSMSLACGQALRSPLQGTRQRPGPSSRRRSQVVRRGSAKPLFTRFESGRRLQPQHLHRDNLRRPPKRRPRLHAQGRFAAARAGVDHPIPCMPQPARLRRRGSAYRPPLRALLRPRPRSSDPGSRRLSLPAPRLPRALVAGRGALRGDPARDGRLRRLGDAAPRRRQVLREAAAPLLAGGGRHPALRRPGVGPSASGSPSSPSPAASSSTPPAASSSAAGRASSPPPSSPPRRSTTSSRSRSPPTCRSPSS
jgi:hypothetical protein